jgi:predicted alpha/beta superfamily hydrolase
LLPVLLKLHSMKNLLLLFTAFLVAHSLQAQLKDLPIQRDSLYSSILKENRALEIVLPTGYDAKNGKKYDVFYVTDGEWNTKIVRDIHQFLELQFLPPCIIVSIPNRYIDGVNQRGRDYTPTHLEWSAGSGGGANYLAFLKNELMPYIDKKYPTNGTNILYGSSLGGLFGLYAFLKEPQLFESYLLSDPAFWWGDHYVTKLLSTKLDSIKILNKSVFIAGRIGEPYKYMGIAAVDSVFKAKLPHGLRWKTSLYDNETHNSMMFMTVYDGLKHTYAGYTNETLRFYPAAGIVEKDKPVTIYAGGELFSDIGYTIDGTEPGATAPKVKDGQFTISQPGQLTIKAFCNFDQYSKKVTGTFKAGGAPSPVSKPKNVKPGGWRYRYYEGDWSNLPDFKKLKPVASGMTDKDFNFTKLPRQQNLACLFEGYVEVKDEGYYTFGIDCEGGVKLFIGNQPIIVYDGLHTLENYQSYVLPLKKGFYPVRLEYFGQRKADLRLVYLTPVSNRPNPIPPDLMYAN